MGGMDGQLASLDWVGGLAGAVMRADRTGPGASSGGTYTVQPRDNLSRIAQRFGTTVQALLAANPGITNLSLIFVGQQLVIPGLGLGQPTVTLVLLMPHTPGMLEQGETALHRLEQGQAVAHAGQNRKLLRVGTIRSPNLPIPVCSLGKGL